ncbi:TlyA family RNA methyltransferase [Pseudoclavibacter alba]|uniref:SAM-dependent methyltransferase n=1 Tax=Pseudoclavibacter albus TaxID=272241 RepID=UPI0019CF55AE|nr:TlyA family RNA methyltransferase [Pseudoclavibacter alba]
MSERLDVALVQRELARSRSAAQRAISEGIVRLNGVPVIRPSIKVEDSDELTVDGPERYVSRAARKLLAMFEAQDDLTAHGRYCLDVGASTGGFTQVLLQRGAAGVAALDVGHAQLHPLIRSDPRAAVIEGENARYLTAARLDECIAASSRWGSVGAEAIDLIVGDVSFISLTHVLPALVASTPAHRDWVLLIKPQFEVGRQGVKGGIVTDPLLALDGVERVIWNAFDLGLGLQHIMESPVLGTHGNREFVARFGQAHEAPERHPEQWNERLRALVLGGARRPRKGTS